MRYSKIFKVSESRAPKKSIGFTTLQALNASVDSNVTLPTKLLKRRQQISVKKGAVETCQNVAYIVCPKTEDIAYSPKLAVCSPVREKYDKTLDFVGTFYETEPFVA